MTVHRAAHAWPAAHVGPGGEAKAHALAVCCQAAAAGPPPPAGQAPLSTAPIAVAELEGEQYMTGPHVAPIVRVAQLPAQPVPL